MKLPLIVAAICLVLGAGVLWLAGTRPADDGIIWAQPDPSPRPFSLVDASGATITDRDLRGRPVLLFFGYSWCPDVCPASLRWLGQLLNHLGPDVGRVQPIFISVDPGRDDGAALARFTALFHPDVRGLTGSPQALGALALAYGVAVRRQDLSDSATGAYLIDHSSSLFLIDAEGRLAGKMDQHTPMPQAVAAVRRLMR